MSNALYHTPNGQFKAGNPGGGRKPRETERRFLDLLRGCVSDADAKEIVKAAIAEAKKQDGNVARKWLFDYLAGPPVQRIAPTDPSGEETYRPFDLSELTDEELGALARVAARLGGPEQGTAEA